MSAENSMQHRSNSHGSNEFKMINRMSHYWTNLKSFTQMKCVLCSSYIVFTSLLLTSSFLLASCATLQEPSKTEMERFWPQPPDPPRISYVKSFSTPRDLGKKRTWLLFVTRFLFGQGSEPNMLRPYGVTTDREGRIYIADTGLQVVHLYDFSGKNYQQIFWIQRGQSRLMSPVGVAVDDDGNLYVSDSQHNRIFVYSAKKRFWLFQLFSGHSVAFELSRVIGEPEQFQRLGGLTYNQKNKLIYVVDSAGHQVVAFDSMGEQVRTIGKRGSGDGEFNFPSHITTGPDGFLYVTDSMNFRVQVLDENGVFINKIGQMGNTLGTFSKPKGVAADSEGHIYVVDGIYDTVQIFDKEGRILMNFGQAGEREGDFWLPNGIAIDQSNQIYLADTYNQRIQVFQFLGSPSPEKLIGRSGP
jgi:DNA-binding beta-propeller fold protein YncE